MSSLPTHQIFYGDKVLERLRQSDGPQGPLIADLLTNLAIWAHRYRSRRVLARLESHELDDIGMTDRQARVESIKPFWRA
ncbi:MAG: DUF1127 domain-containing protein [Pseudomonadota bacterium]